MLLNCGVWEDSWESLDCKEIQPVHSKGNQSWMFIRRTDVEAETPILWPSDAKSWLIFKDPNAGKDWRQEEKGTTEDDIMDSMDMSLSKLQELVTDTEAWRAVVYGVTKSRIRLSNWTELNWTDRSEKAMAPHSSTLAWKIPWTEEPGGLQSMGSLRVRQDWVTSLSLFTFMHWRRKWQTTPVFLPGESQGWGSLVGCRLWGRTESDMTDVT